jgi:TolA-binding protein
MRSRFLACLLLATAAPLTPAQTPLRPPAPLVAAVAPDALLPGQAAATLAAAERAQAMGFPSIAAELYRRLLAAPAGVAGDPFQLRLALATALLDDGRPDEAGLTLNEDVRARDAAWQLRAGLIAAQTKRPDAAKASLAVIKPEELSAADRGWYFFLQGMVADAAADWDRGRAAYGEALKAAGNEMERTRFELAQELAYLRRGVANLDAQRQNAERIQGRYGYEASRQYAIGLDAVGRKSEAVAVLQRLLAALPAEERAEIDKVRLLLGLIAGAAEGGVGRNALFQLLTTGQDAGKQRIALHLLAQRSVRGVAALEFRRKLDELIGAPAPHPILEYLRLYRAQAALVANDYAQAKADAKELLNRFPGSPLRAPALGVLTSSAWEQGYYRIAADYATKARAELPDGAARRQLGVLVAEAWYRAGEYRNAADAYGAVLNQPPPGERQSKSALLFQRVQAEIEAGGLQAAPALLDQLGRDPDFDSVDRWEAEWNLARALQTAGQTAAALARVNQLLAAPPGPAARPVELGARMAWLQVRLAREAGQPAETVRLAGKLAPALAGVTAELRAEIASSAALLKAQAELDLEQVPAALESLKRLRADFPKSDAAVYSFIVEADYYAGPGRDQTVEAQKLLTKLAEDYKSSPYAPYALYRAAQLAERRGQDDNFKEANKLLVDLALKYPQSDLVFYARLKQGDLLRKLNDFPAAQQVYESLVNTFPRHRDGFAAQMALADCRAAQAATDPTQAERAAEIYERLLYMAAPDPRIELPVELRVEAGYKLGASLNRRGQPARAQEIWWRDVVNEFLLKEGRAAQLGTKGRYWMGRTLVDLGTLCEQQEKLEEARQAWQLVVDSRLPGAALAQAKLARFNLPPLPAKP